MKSLAIRDGEDCIRKFVSAASWSEAAPFVTFQSGPDLGARYDPERLSRLRLDTLSTQRAQRVPGTDHIVTEHIARFADASPLLFRVQHTPDGAKVRLDFLQQQLDGNLSLFLRNPGAAPIRAFVAIDAPHPEPGATTPQHDPRTAIEVTIRSPFPDFEAFNALIPGNLPSRPELLHLFELTQSIDRWVRLGWKSLPDGSSTIVVLDVESDLGIIAESPA